MLKSCMFVAVLAAALLLMRVEPASVRAQENPAGGTAAQRLVDHVAVADRIVRGTVTAVSSRFGSNAYGDHLILSSVTISVSETLKGRRDNSVTVEVLGGTVGTFTLIVSQYPEPVTVADPVVAMTERNQVIPAGWMKLNAAGDTVSGIATVAELRTAIQGSF